MSYYLESFDATLEGGMRTGGRLLISWRLYEQDDTQQTVIRCGELTSTVHKSQRRARAGAPLLDMVMRAIIVAVHKRLVTNPKDSTAKAALTQVVNRFLISFLEEGVLTLCDWPDAMELARDLKRLYTMCMSINKQTVQGQSSDLPGRTASLATSIIMRAADLYRGRIISLFGSDDVNRPEGVWELPPRFKSIEKGRNFFEDFATAQGRHNFQQCMRVSTVSSTQEVKAFYAALMEIPCMHREYATMMYRAILIDSLQLDIRKSRQQITDAHTYKHPPYGGVIGYGASAIGQPPMASFEECVQAFGIRDSHTAFGDFTEFLEKGSQVEQFPKELMVYGYSLDEWNRRYKRLREEVVPERHRRRGQKRPLVESTAAAAAETVGRDSNDHSNDHTNDHTNDSSARDFAMRFDHDVVAQLPTGKHKARVQMVCERSPDTNLPTLITTACKKAFYAKGSYENTKYNYLAFKTLCPELVSQWHFDDEQLTIHFPPLPGDSKMPFDPSKTCRLTKSFFDTSVYVIDVSMLNYRPIKDGKQKDLICPSILTNHKALFDLVKSCMVQRTLGIGDVSPRNHLLCKDPQHEDELVVHAIDMSDNSPTINPNADTFVDKIFSARTGRDCPLREAINRLFTTDDLAKKDEMVKTCIDLCKRASCTAEAQARSSILCKSLLALAYDASERERKWAEFFA